MLHPAKLPIEKLFAECHEARTRGSGPGGQHRNKVETAVVFTHQPSQVSGAASERRSLQDNRKVAIQRLRVNLAIALRSDSTEALSESWIKYVTGGKVAINPLNEDFPALLADALDLVHAFQGDLSEPAELLRISPTQLLKFLRLEPAAWTVVAKVREAAGLKRLK
ncbi:MAG: peptide chain release factor-like protein [Pirellulaceae bacterium]|nr:peptide chain release factor-like protein [Pirellulaceae bacterium]